MLFPRFGEIYWADNLQADRHVQGGARPVLICQNDIGNKYSPTVNVLPLSTKISKAKHLPIHVDITKNDANGLKEDSIVLVEQIRTVNKSDLKQKIATVSTDALRRIKHAYDVQFPFPA